MQGTRVQSSVREDPTCRGGPHMPWSTTEPVLWSPGTTTTEPTGPRACAPQQEKPPQWETHTPQLGKSPGSNKDLENKPTFKIIRKIKWKADTQDANKKGLNDLYNHDGVVT